MYEDNALWCIIVMFYFELCHECATANFCRFWGDKGNYCNSLIYLVPGAGVEPAREVIPEGF